MKRQIKISVIVIIALIVAAIFLASRTVKEQDPEFSVEQLELEINHLRMSYGVDPLVVHPLLNKSAQMKADDIVANGYWSHTNPEGKSFYEWIQTAGYHYLYAGENLANGINNPYEVVARWQESDGHRRNLLNEHFTNMGIGVAYLEEPNGEVSNGFIAVLHLGDEIDPRDTHPIK